MLNKCTNFADDKFVFIVPFSVQNT